MKQNHKSKPIVSVIVAAFNQEKFIGRCLRSLINQSLSSDLYEIIVVDDGSDDLTDYALGLFEGGFGVNIRIITHERNLGLPAAVNRGIMEAQGTFVVRVDSDDFVNANFLNFLFCFLDFNDHVDAVACDYFLIDDKEKFLRRVNCLEEPIACGLMFRKTQLIQLGMYDENLRWHEDQDLRIRFLKKHNISRLELPLYRYRRHSDNMTNNKNAMDYHKMLLREKHDTKD